MSGRSHFCLALLTTCLVFAGGTPAQTLRRALTVWTPKSRIVRHMGSSDSHLEDYNWTPLLTEYKRDFPDLALRWKMLEREQFARAMRPGQSGLYLEVAFVDNASELDPLLNANAVVKNCGG